jgi:PAS domain S-box-containing protein
LLFDTAQGVIMMVNSAAVTMFGYQKGELEGKNVNVLM